MTLVQQSGNPATASFSLQGYAGLAATQKQARKAIALFAVTQKLQEEMADKTILSPAGDLEFERNLAIAREQVDEATFDAAWAEGRAMSLEQAIEYALAE